MIPMIGKHKNWRFLLRDLQEKFPDFRRLTERELKGLFALPATIAYWIHNEHPELLQKDALNILVVGAHLVDAVDKGAWYSAIPLFLSSNIKIKVDLVGPELWEQGRLGEINTTHSKILPLCAAGHKMLFSEYAEKNENIDADLCILFHPGLQAHADKWVETGDLDRISALNIPTLLTFYDQTEAINDRLCLLANGYENLKDPIDNPFCMDTKHDFAGHGYHYLSELPPKTETAENDDYYLDLYHISENITGYEFETRGVIKGLLDIGEKFTFPAKLSRDIFIKLGIGFYASLSTNEIYHFNEEEELVGTDCFCEEAIDELAELEEIISPYDKFIWALTVLNDFFEEQEEMDSAEDDDFEELMSGVSSLLRSLIPKEIVVPAKHKKIINALRDHNDDLVMELLKKDPSLIEAQTKEGYTPLYCAAANNNIPLTNFLLNLGANPNHQDGEGWPLIVELVQNECYDTLGIFVKLKNLDIHRRTSLGWSPILMAASQNDRKAVQLLLEGGADLNDEHWAMHKTAKDMLAEFDNIKHQSIH